MAADVLILSSRAPEYAALLRGLLEGVTLLATADPQEARARGASCEVVLGDPGLLRPVLGDLPRLRWVVGEPLK